MAVARGLIIPAFDVVAGLSPAARWYPRHETHPSLWKLTFLLFYLHASRHYPVNPELSLNYERRTGPFRITAVTV